MSQGHTGFVLYFQICANGLVKFKDGDYARSPRNFGTYEGQETGQACLAPYWSFVDLDYFETEESKVFYRKYTDQDNNFRDIFPNAKEYGNKILKLSNYSPSWVMVVTWLNLKPKEGLATYGGVRKLTFFNLLISFKL